MQSSVIARTLAGPLVILVLVGLGWLTRDTWKSWLIPSKKAPEEAKEEHSDNPERVKISEQAQQNLRLVLKEVDTTTYWRKISIPGVVVDRPGHSDRGISAPLAGIVTQISVVPGKALRPGAEAFRLKILSDSFQTSQMELYKYTRELQIAQEEHKRLQPLIESGAVAPTRGLELEYQQQRFKAMIDAHREDLSMRHLTDKQIKGIERKQFVTELVVRVPDRLGKLNPLPSANGPSSEETPIEYEVQELKVNLGDHVQAGQVLAYIADHRFLYLEGKALKQEAKLLIQAAKEGWPVDAEFTDEDDETPGNRLENLSIEFLGSTMDASGLVLPVYVPFANPQQEYVRQGKTYRAGQYRPGQKVLLKVPVAKLVDIFVVPVAGVVRDGPEAYVFRQNGSAFDRKAVHVLAEDADVVVIADDGSIVPGNFIAQNGAAALNRVLKASQAAGGGGHSHEH